MRGKTKAMSPGRLIALALGIVLLSTSARAGDVLFSQTEFDDLSDWTVLAGSWIPSYDSNVLYEVGVPPSPVGCLLLENVASADYCVSATVSLAGTAAGLILRYADERNFYLLLFTNRQRRLIVCLDGRFSTLGSQQATTPYLSPTTVVFSCIGSRLQVVLGEERIFDVTDGSVRFGEPALVTARSFETGFDDIVVTAIGPGGVRPGFDELPEAAFESGTDTQDLYDADDYVWDLDTAPGDLAVVFDGDVPPGIALEVDDEHSLDVSSDGIFEGPFVAQASVSDGTWTSFEDGRFDAEPPADDGDAPSYPLLCRMGIQPSSGYWSQGSKAKEHQSRYDVVIWNPGFGAGRVDTLKEANPAVKVIASTGDYVCFDPKTGNYLDPEEYVLRDSKGNPVVLDQNFGFAIPNIGQWQVEIDGVGPAEYLAKKHLDAMDLDNNPWDGVGHDWMQSSWWGDPRDFDYNRDGINDFDQGELLGDPIRLFREGHRAYLMAMKDEFKRRTGRDPIVYYNPGSATDWMIDDVDGHLIEGFFLGGTWGQIFDDLKLWTTDHNKLWFFTNKLGGPGWENNDIPDFPPGASLNKRKQSNYRYMRYGLTLCLMGGGYYDVSGVQEHEFGYWYDEFELDLGQPLGAFHKLEKGNDCSDRGGDVYVRFFDEGVAIHYAGVNCGEATATVSDDELKQFPEYNGPYYRFRGNQDPEWNNGTLFDQVTLRGTESSRAPGQNWNGSIGDGIVLLRQPRTVVSDIVVGTYDVQDSSPGTRAAEFVGPWDNKSYPSTGDPSTENPYWAKLVYNTHVDFGGYDSYGHKEAVPGQHSEAHFRPRIGRAGVYGIHEWHGWIGTTDDEYREATNVRWELRLDGETVMQGRMNQDVDKGQWNVLGEMYLPEGERTELVIFADGADSKVIADAVMFRYFSE